MKGILTALSLLLASGCLALTDHACQYDEIARSGGKMEATIVQEVPTKGQGNWQAYTATASTTWAPIRFRVFSKDLVDPNKYCGKVGDVRPTFKDVGTRAKCSENDILTTEKKAVLTGTVITEALKLHSDRLMVNPVRGSIVLSLRRYGFCSLFTVPPDHFVKGVSGADMLLYVAAGPTSGITAAWAGACSYAADGRPIVGFANFGPHAIGTTRRFVRIAAHEIGHALGFDFGTMLKKKMTTKQTTRGVERNVVNSPKTLAMVREYYNCQPIAGMELENEGGYGTANSHWERRNAKEELMTGMANGGDYYTAFTMAAFEDMGFYKAIWGSEEKMYWGHNAGCSFLTSKCMRNGVSMFPDMFCTGREPGNLCTSDRRGLGRCQVVTYTSNLSESFRYFPSPVMGGHSAQLTDYCPIVHPYDNAMCGGGDSFPGNRMGPSSMCLRGDDLTIYRSYKPGDICAEVRCIQNVVSVRYSDDENWYPCPEGSTITPRGIFTGGEIVCPERFRACPESSDPPAAPVPERNHSQAGGNRTPVSRTGSGAAPVKKSVSETAAQEEGTKPGTRRDSPPIAPGRTLPPFRPLTSPAVPPLSRPLPSPFSPPGNGRARVSPQPHDVEGTATDAAKASTRSDTARQSNDVDGVTSSASSPGETDHLGQPYEGVLENGTDAAACSAAIWSAAVISFFFFLQA